MNSRISRISTNLAFALVFFAFAHAFTSNAAKPKLDTSNSNSPTEDKSKDSSGDDGEFVRLERLVDSNVDFDFSQFFDNDDDGSDDNADNLDLAYVATSRFELELGHAHSHYDVLRLFYGRGMSDSSLDRKLRGGHLPARGENKDLEERDLVLQLHKVSKHMRKMADVEAPRPEVVRATSGRLQTSGAKLQTATGKVFVPAFTEIYRCPSDDRCCRPAHRHGGYKCLPVSSEQVTLPFMILHKFENEVMLDPDDVFVRLTFENHTKCGCERDEHVTSSDRVTSDHVTSDHVADAVFGTNRRAAAAVAGGSAVSEEQSSRKSNSCEGVVCASAFSKRATAKGCLCDCFDSDASCLVVKRGHRKLDRDDLSCVRSGNCRLPTCAKGIFNALSGRCSKWSTAHNADRSSQRRRRPKSADDFFLPK